MYNEPINLTIKIHRIRRSVLSKTYHAHMEILFYQGEEYNNAHIISRITKNQQQNQNLTKPICIHRFSICSHRQPQNTSKYSLAYSLH